MNLRNLGLLLLSGVLIVSYAVAAELSFPKLSFETAADGTLIVTEEDSRWELVPQSPPEILDIRIFGTNENSVRANTKGSIYVALATHILVLVDRELANEVYLKSNCEAGAAQKARGAFTLTKNESAYESLQTMKLKAAVPGLNSRVCAELKGRYYSLMHFSVHGMNLDSQFERMKMQGGMPGLDPKNIFVVDSAEELPCER